MSPAPRLGLIAAGLALALGLAGCAGGPRPRPPSSTPYLAPTWRPGQLDAAAAREMGKAWREVVSGKGRAAERRYRRVLARHPGLVPARAGVAYAQLAAGRAREASGGFAAVLARQPEYLPALVGAGVASVRLGDAGAALGFYKQAQALSPDSGGLARRVGELKIQVTEARVAASHAALAAGHRDRAVAELREALAAAPEVAGLRLELAKLLLEGGSQEEAVAVLADDPSGDRQVLMRLAELRDARGEYALALDVYRRILSRDPGDAEAMAKALETRQELEQQRMPAEYRQIPGANRITRADLAALLSVKVTALDRAQPGDPPVAVDISGSWARPHILKTLSLDLMDVYPNHTFQPGALVRRGDLASAAARVLDCLGWPPAAPVAVSDMSRNHLDYAAVSRVVAAGLMKLTPEGAFEPWRLVSGQDAIDVVESLARLVGP